MRALLVFGGLLAAASSLIPTPQQGREGCAVEIETTPGTVTHVTRLADGGRRFDAGGGVEATCGNKWVRADSATWFESGGLLHLFGNVRFRDPQRTLQADRATYFGDEDRLRSEGNVRLSETESGSTLTGPVLDYYPSNATRLVERIFAPRRPHLKYYPASASAERGTPFDVDANRIHIYGDSALAGRGEVVAVREDLEATGDSIDLNLKANRLWLFGEPRVVANNTSLEGDTIVADLQDGDIREIRAWPAARAEGEDLSLTGPLLTLFVEEGEIIRTVASAGDPERTGVIDSAGRDPWASSESADYTLIADSIDILRPAGRLDRVLALRRARAASQHFVVPGDSLMGRDWISGDTVIGYFAATDSPAAADTTALERLVASGNARALHIQREQGQTEQGGNATAERPGINYVIGEIVTLWIGQGEVDSVTVIGPATGINIRPTPLAADSAAGADSLAVPSDSADIDTSGVVFGDGTARLQPRRADRAWPGSPLRGHRRGWP